MTAKILIQIDADRQASVFDAVVAIDAGIDQLLQYSRVEPSQVQGLVHGAIFTRGIDALRHTALFVGGSDVQRGEELVDKIEDSFFGPMRVSVMMDANGSNTTAAAAVLSAARHLPYDQTEVLVLAGTGPVGQRVARLTAGLGATVRVASRDEARAELACDAIRQRVHSARLVPAATSSPARLIAALRGAQIVFACGAPGARLLDAEAWKASCESLAVAIDLNAVPPLGIEGVDVRDKAQQRDGVICYGAIGVGGLKMKIHKAAIARLFTANDQRLDAEQMLEIGRELE